MRDWYGGAAAPFDAGVFRKGPFKLSDKEYQRYHRGHDAGPCLYAIVDAMLVVWCVYDWVAG
jgi:hypothetical protein